MVISDLLDYASMDDGPYLPGNHTFDLRKVIENCVASFRLSAEQQGTVLELQFPGAWPETLIVAGDGPRVRQVLASLIESAVVVSGESGQAPLPATGSMGLVVVQKLVELMGGHVKVGVEETGGSSICFELPFRLAMAETVDSKER